MNLAAEQEKTVMDKWLPELKTAVLNAQKSLEECKYVWGLVSDCPYNSCKFFLEMPMKHILCTIIFLIIQTATLSTLKKKPQFIGTCCQKRNHLPSAKYPFSPFLLANLPILLHFIFLIKEMLVQTTTVVEEIKRKCLICA